MNDTASTSSTGTRKLDFSSPTKECDIVMKGGVTSGIVYPLAVCQLAETYEFRCIGGTSAGAIAAAATAAAELGRRKQKDGRLPIGPDGIGSGFIRFSKLPQEFGEESRPGSGRTKLSSLFQPDSETRRLFSVVDAALNKPWPKGAPASHADVGTRKTKGHPMVRMAMAALSSYIGRALLFALPGLVLGALAMILGSGAGAWIALFLGLVIAAIGAVVGTVFGIKRDVATTLPANNYGLCRGRGTGKKDQPPALIDWLTDYLDELAGIGTNGPPLTFGDLWDQKDEHAPHAIELQMMTTNLTQGRPYSFPDIGATFYFRESDLRKYFSDRVVDWMISCAPPQEESSFPGYLPMPDPRDLPVIVATRMSLSFPVLFSAVPLYSIDFSRRNKADRVPELCLFADGGICSNFPVHFFDSPLPGRPTFAINLKPFHVDYPEKADERENVWSPKTNGDGTLNQWNRIDGSLGIGSVSGFFGLIVNAMQNWSDNMQLSIPGFRDRIVHVYQTPDEGGLNLNMDRRSVLRLAERGRCAGDLLVMRFTKPTPEYVTTWDNHRWVRYRTTMQQIESYLGSMLSACESATAGDKTYFELIDRGPEDLPDSYRWGVAQSRHAKQATTDLLEVARRWRSSGHTFTENAPRPMPELRTRPRI